MNSDYNEYNATVTTNGTQSEKNSLNLNQSFSEKNTTTSFSYGELNDRNYTIKKKKKKNKVVERILTSFIAVFVVAVVGVNYLGIGSDFTPRAKIYLDTASTGVYYDVEIDEDYPLKGYITVTVENDFTNRRQTFDTRRMPEGRFINGSEENLKENMSYKIRVLDGDKLLAEESFSL